MHCLSLSVSLWPTLGPYKQGPTLGQGQFGKVKIGANTRTHQKVALKVTPHAKMEKSKLQKEIELQRKLNHKHVIRLYESFEVKDSVVMVLELASGGDLLEYLLSYVRLPEDEARRLFQQLISAVQHCHQNGVVHRDIKPENILLDLEKNIKLCDFGLAAEVYEGQILTESCGSPNYAAPELLRKDCRYKGPEIDVWSCGVVLYALLCNNLPFDAATIQDLFKQIKQGRYRVPGYVPWQAKDLTNRILTVDPTQRITTQTIVLHPWFARNLPDGLYPPHDESSQKREGGKFCRSTSEDGKDCSAKGGARAYRWAKTESRQALHSCRVRVSCRGCNVWPRTNRQKVALVQARSRPHQDLTQLEIKTDALLD